MTELGSIQSVAVPSSVPAGRPAGSSSKAFSEVLSKGMSHPTANATRNAPPVSEWLSQVESGQKKLDQILQQARAGKTFSPRELLSLQSEFYRLTEELSLVQRTLEEGLSTVKRVMTMSI